MAGIVLFVGAMIAVAQKSVVENGKEVYAVQKCSVCHSISGVGGEKMPLDGVASRLKSEDIKKWIQKPKQMKSDTTMKAYPNLPSKALDDLTAYLMTLK
jgi:cytochrome c2